MLYFVAFKSLMGKAMFIEVVIGYITAGAFYMLAEFAFMVWKARILHRHYGNLLFLTILFIPCAFVWPYFAIKRILHDEKNNI